MKRKKKKKSDSDPDEELDVELAKLNEGSTKTKPRRQSRRMSHMLRRSSIISAKSVASVTSESGNDVETIVQDEETTSISYANYIQSFTIKFS